MLGTSVTSEALGIPPISDDGEGLVRAMRLAFEESGLSPGELGMLTAHGNGTQGSDATELMAFREVLGDSAVPITGFKWSLAHTLAASGLIEAILTLMSLEHDTVPAIPSLEQPAPEVGSLNVVGASQSARPRARSAMLVSRAFAGLNACLVISNEAEPG